MNGIEVTVDGESVTVNDKDDVLSVFKTETEIAEGKKVEEWVVDTIDTEFDYNRVEDTNILRAIVYFTSLNPVSSGWVRDSDLEFDNWSRENYTLGDDRLGVTYEREM